MNPEEIKKLTRFFRAKFQLQTIEVRKRMQKKDSAEVYIGDEFIATVSLDAEEGGRDFTLQMSILEIDLDGT